MQCCFHDKKKLPYRVKWGVFTFYVRCVIALKTNDNTSPQPRTVLLEVEQYKHLLNCHYVIQRNRGFLDEYCINMRSLRHISTLILIQSQGAFIFAKTTHFREILQIRNDRSDFCSDFRADKRENFNSETIVPCYRFFIGFLRKKGAFVYMEFTTIWKWLFCNVLRCVKSLQQR